MAGVLPAAVGIIVDFKMVKLVDPDATHQHIREKKTRIAALVNEPPKQILEIDKTMIVINCSIIEHLPL